jgi:hypothetical protein
MLLISWKNSWRVRSCTTVLAQSNYYEGKYGLYNDAPL